MSTTPPTPSSLTPGMLNQAANGSKDIKVQLDQFFFGSTLAVTLAWYHGMIPLADPSNTVMWENHFDSERVYLTYSVLPNQVDILAGVLMDSSSSRMRELPAAGTSITAAFSSARTIT